MNTHDLFQKHVTNDRIKRSISLTLKAFHDEVGSNHAYKTLCKLMVTKHPGFFPELENKVRSWFSE